MADSTGTTLLTVNNPNPPPAPPERLLGLPPWVWLLALLVAYLGFCAARFAPAISCADANGYWAQGTRLAHTGQTWFVPTSDIQYVGAHWLVTPEGKYYSRYPAGLPVAIALVTKLFGYRASVLLNPFFAVLALVGTYFLARRLAGPRWALLAPLFLALNPTFARHALQNDSHMAVVCLLAGGLALLVAWSETGSLCRLFLGAMLLGAIPTVRYPEALYALGIGTFLIWRSLSLRRPWLHVLVGGSGALLPLVPLMIHNQFAFGAFWNTAYSLTNEQTGFGWDYFQQHAIQYLDAIQGDGLGVLFAVGLGGIGALCAYRKRRAEGFLFLLLIVPSTLLYMAYYWAPRMMTAGTMRFLLPTFVCYAVAGTWLLSQLTPRVPRGALITGTSLLVAIYVIWGGLNLVSDTRRDVAQRRALALVTAALEEHAEEGSVVLANQQLLQQLDFVGKWKLAEPGELRGRGPGMRRGAMANRDPDAPSPMQAEKQRIQEERYAGLTPFARLLRTSQELKTWADGHPIYLIGEPEEVRRFEETMVGGSRMQEVARVAFPEEWRKSVTAPSEGPGGMPGPGGPGGLPGADGAPAGMGGNPGVPVGPNGMQPMGNMPMQGMDRPLAGGMSNSRPLGGGMGMRPNAGMDMRTAGGMGMRPGMGQGQGMRPGGGPGGMRSYPLSCEELVIVQIVPRT